MSLENKGEHQALPHRWVKGVSGNPGGRPAIVARVREIAQAHTEEGLRQVVEMARDPNNDAKLRLAAWREVFDRAMGRPTIGTPNDDGSQPAAIVFTWADDNK
jgi:hypothetical protein